MKGALIGEIMPCFCGNNLKTPMKQIIPASPIYKFFLTTTYGFNRAVICREFLSSLGIHHNTDINLIVSDYPILGAWEVLGIGGENKINIVNDDDIPTELITTNYLWEFLIRKQGRFILIEPAPTTTKTLKIIPHDGGEPMTIESASLAVAFEILTQVTGYDEYREMKKCYISLWKDGSYKGSRALFLWE